MEVMLITDRRLRPIEALWDFLPEAARAGLTSLMVREKDLPGRPLLAMVREAVSRCRPLGIAVEIGNTFWTLGPIVTLYLAGLLSANLAVVNILPLPPLDGGRILVLLLKRVLGTRLSLRAERLTYLVGAAFLFAFLIWVTAFDVIRPAAAARGSWESR